MGKASRYYKLTDKAMMQKMADYYQSRVDLQERADEFGKKYNMGRAGFVGHGMWDLRLIGFACSKHDHSFRDDRSLWKIPKKGYTRPKANKGSHIYKDYIAEYKSLCIDGKKIEEMLGFNSLTYFPTRPGYNYNADKNFMVFVMPAVCDSVNGCIEITNIEYLELTSED